MKKATMEALVRYLNGESVTNIDEIKEELETELRKNAEKAATNRKAYDAARGIFKAALTNKGQTIADIWEKTKTEMQAIGMTKSKIQFAVREYWAEDVIKDEGKVNEYRKRA